MSDKPSIDLEFEVLRAIASMGKWLIASLITINGGAAIAILQSQRLPIDLIRFSAGNFAIGVIAAIVAGASTIFLLIGLLTKSPRTRFGQWGDLAYNVAFSSVAIAATCGSAYMFMDGVRNLAAAPISDPKPALYKESRNSDCGIVGTPPKGRS